MNAKTFYAMAERTRSHVPSTAMMLLAMAPYVVAITIAYLFYSDILPHFRPYAWVDDWIYSKPIEFETFREWWSWLWQQHVDHRIPIQKLFSFLVLSFSGFDYRWLVAINFSMALATSLLLIEVAKRYRGTRSIGDIAIPLIILNFGMGYTQWGFHFQFMSSVLFMSSFLLSTLIWLQSQKTAPALFAVLSLILASLTGMNGVLPTLGVGLAFTVWAIWRRKSVGVVFLFAVPLGMASVILATWTRYNVGDFPPINIGEFLGYTVGLSTASFTFYLQNYETVARAFMGTLVLLAAASFIFRALRKDVDDTDLLLLAFLGVYLCLIASISYGRVKVQGGWEYGSAVHYGVLTIFIPVISWMILSRSVPKLISEVLGVAVLVFAVLVFQANYQWRTWMIGYDEPLQSKTLQDLRSNKSIDQIAADNIKQFHVGMGGMKEVTDGISVLRKAGFELYGGKP